MPCKQLNYLHTVPCMPKPPPAPAGSQARILAIASRLFASRGFHGVPVREIAIECGLTMPTIYHFFGSKEALYGACLAKVRDDALARLRKAMVEGSPEKRVDAFVRTFCRLLLEEPACLSFAFQAATISLPGIDATPLTELIASLDELIAASGVDVRPAGLTPGELLVACAIGQAAVRRALRRGLAPDDPDSLEDLVGQVRAAALPSASGTTRS